MVRKVAERIFRKGFYKKVYPKPQEVYKQLSNTYKAVIGVHIQATMVCHFVLLVLFLIYIPTTSKGDL